jgi:hypothetical protein
MATNPKTAWYRENAKQTQKNRIIKGLLNGTRQVTEKTLQKYGIEKDKNGKIVIPQVQKVRYNIDTIAPQSTPKSNVIDIVVTQKTSPIQMYDMSNTAFTGREMEDFCSTYIPKIEPLATKTLEAYKNLARNIYELYGEELTKSNENEDLTPWLTDADVLIEAIPRSTRWKVEATWGKALGQILRVAEVWPPFTKRLTDDNRQKLQIQADTWLTAAKLRRTDKSKITPHFEFETIRKAVLDKYGKFSYENLYFKMYDVIIPRDDLNSFIIVKTEKEMVVPKQNYILLDRSNKKGIIYMIEYKTKKIYYTKKYPLTAELVEIINNLHGKLTQLPNKLFPNLPDKLTDWVKKITKSIPELAVDNITITYLRHSVISSRLIELQSAGINNKAAKMVELANIAMNSTDTQSQSYIYPLKKLNGREFISEVKLKKANEKVVKTVSNYNLRSKK